MSTQKNRKENTFKSGLMKAALAGVLAASAGSLAFGSTALAQSKPAQDKVKCYGVNSCKGTGACGGKTADGKSHSCAGQNSCKGQGWLKISADECQSKGGSTKPKS